MEQQRREEMSDFGTSSGLRNDGAIRTIHGVGDPEHQPLQKDRGRRAGYRDRETCGPCNSEAACTHGCRGSYHGGGLLKSVVDYKNPEVVLRVAEKTPCTLQDAEALFEEMKQYLARSATGARASSPTRAVDLAWHEFILFTQDYAEFCEEHFGRFIHHVPTPRLMRVGLAVG